MSEIHKLINSVWNKEELSQQWKDTVIVPIDEKGDKIDCSNYRELSLLQTTHTVFSNSLLSWLTAYVDEITGDNQCGFRHNR
jgi:sorting nexin-29